MPRPKRANIATALQLKLDEIMARWEALVHASMPKALRMNPTALRDSLPQLLAMMSEVLAGKKQRRKLEEYKGIATYHAKTRANLEDFTIDHVLFEYSAMRRTIFEVLRESARIRNSDLDQILDLLESASREAVAEFSQLQYQKREQLAGRLNLALTATGTGVWEWDIAQNHYWQSANHRRIYGFATKAAWSFEDFLKHIYPGDQTRIQLSIQKALQQAVFWHDDFRVKWPDGSLHWIQKKAKILRDKAGRATRMLGTVTDISDEKKSKDERIQLLNLAQLDLDRLRSEREMRERFVATLSHDLRTPLTTAQMSAQLLLKNPAAALTFKPLLNKIIESISRADLMIQDLLDANWVRGGQKLPIQVKSCDLRTVAEAVLVDFTVLHGSRFTLISEPSVQGYWDDTGLRRVMENMLSNAVKYSTPDTPIELKVEENENRVRILVHNSGGELSPAEQRTAFEPFRRGNAARASHQKGWGIGLVLIRGITEAHGGAVDVKSEPGKGTTFCVELPRDARPYQVMDKQSEPGAA